MQATAKTRRYSLRYANTSARNFSAASTTTPDMVLTLNWHNGLAALKADIAKHRKAFGT